MTNLPDIFGFYSPDSWRRYHASHNAVALFGHDIIIRCIELACSDETGAIRDLNVDRIPIEGVEQQLVIVRTPDNRLIFALADDEFPIVKEWFMNR